MQEKRLEQTEYGNSLSDSDEDSDDLSHDDGRIYYAIIFKKLTRFLVYLSKYLIADVKYENRQLHLGVVEGMLLCLI